MVSYQIELDSERCRIALKGELLCSVVDEIKKKVEQIISTGTNAVVFDFTQVSRIDSSGIGFLIDVYKILSRSNRSMQVINVSESIMATFQSMRLDARLDLRAKEK